jgi:hypothetical protein
VGNDPIDRVDPLGERWPDYYYFNINIAIPNPWTATLGVADKILLLGRQ